MDAIDAITAANGWAMALTGALIVLTGLSVLSLIISQLHKLATIIDNRTSRAAASGAAPEETCITREPTPRPPLDFLDMDDATAAYHPLIDQMEQPFTLKAIFHLTEENSFPHTHLTIRNFREAGKLIPAGDGLFTWDPKGKPAACATEPSPPRPVAAPAPVAGPPTAAAAPAPGTAAAPAAVPPTPAEPSAATDGTAMTAPMPGMIVRYDKQVGDTVTKGETVVILEAMKMENALPAAADGTINSINFASGDTVAKGDVLCVIG